MTARRFFVDLHMTEHLTVLADSRAEAITILEDAMHRGALEHYKSGQKPEARFEVQGHRREPLPLVDAITDEIPPVRNEDDDGA